MDLPAALAAIGTNTFRGCTSLPSIDLPASVTAIGNNAFNGDASLTEVISRADVPPALGGTGVFTGCTSLTAIKVPAASVDAYRAAPRWSAYAAIITAL